MWFRPDSTDTAQFVRAVWDIARWLVLGPVVGGVSLLIFALLIGVNRAGWINALVWGAAFGFIAGVTVTGFRWMARWKV
ncbi:MAG: hypothetical protein JXN59_13055 [Anaerolineae bacterium]|nr:hypothetical protein [Anaerolineae bacterium]